MPLVSVVAPDAQQSVGVDAGDAVEVAAVRDSARSRWGSATMRTRPSAR